MKPARFASLKKESLPQRLLRGLFSRLPTRWRGAVMLSAFAVLFPFWLTSIVWEAVTADGASSSREVENP
jgi:hypothetical protein